jgi:hypothetical protein
MQCNRFYRSRSKIYICQINQHLEVDPDAAINSFRAPRYRCDSALRSLRKMKNEGRVYFGLWEKLWGQTQNIKIY